MNYRCRVLSKKQIYVRMEAERLILLIAKATSRRSKGSKDSKDRKDKICLENLKMPLRICERPNF